ncbi:MAG: hypothetical protein JSS24_16160, partial [Proteobacteria bacterium]|nr:hypothetical protein [Pseudomonadota bacterium]
IERIDAAGAQPVSARLSSPALNPRALLLTPAAPLTTGRYRVWLRTAPGLQLADLSAQPLALPTGGEERLIVRFEVVNP